MELPITDALVQHPYFRQCLALSESYEAHSVAGPDVLIEAGELMEAIDQDPNSTRAQKKDAKALLNFVEPNKSWDEETVSKYFQSAILRYYDRRTDDEKSFEEAITRFTEMVGKQHSSTSAVAGAMGRGARQAQAAIKSETPEEAEKRKARNKKKALQKKNKAKERKEAGLPPKPKEPKEDPALYDEVD